MLQPGGHEPIAKQERQAAKNGFVFPSFYGSSFAKSYLGIWKQIPQETKDHLAKHGIKDKGEILRDKTGRITKVTGFAAHVKVFIDEKLWKRFSGTPNGASTRLLTATVGDTSSSARDSVAAAFGFHGVGELASAGNQLPHCFGPTCKRIIIRGTSGRSSIVCSIHDAPRS